MTNIGYKPTVDGSFLGVETYLFGTEENMYGCEVEVHLLKFRRAEKRFRSVDEMQKDIAAGREFFHV